MSSFTAVQGLSLENVDSYKEYTEVLAKDKARKPDFCPMPTCGERTTIMLHCRHECRICARCRTWWAFDHKLGEYVDAPCLVDLTMNEKRAITTIEVEFSKGEDIGYLEYQLAMPYIRKGFTDKRTQEYRAEWGAGWNSKVEAINDMYY